ncbi:MAG: hypothetical protein O3A51_08460, partial [Verrucomicrobia bacterium]|nr:hypothetical protein [Verrucomicrobiota bacterium]
QVPQSLGTPITRGKDLWLYETEYVKFYRKPRGIRERDRQKFVTDLKALQDELDARGIVFALVISPSKPEIIPDYLPENIIAERAASQRRSAYDELVPELEAFGVRFFDGRAFFLQLKRDNISPLFARGGTHWTYYAAFLFCQHILQEIQPTLPDNLIVPELGELDWQLPQGSDKDLAAMLNLITFNPLTDELPYPTAIISPLPITERPDVLMVGDSFSYTLLDALNTSRSVGKLDLLYYFKRYFDYPEADLDGPVMPHVDFQGAKIDRSDIDWDHLLLSRQIVLLEINEILLKSRSWGFVQGALEYLRSDTVTDE